MTYAKKTSGVGSRKSVQGSRKSSASAYGKKKKIDVIEKAKRKDSKHYKTIMDAYKKIEMQGMTRHEAALYLNGYTKEQTKLSDYDLQMIEIRKKIEEDKKWLDSTFKKKPWFMRY